MYSKGHILDLSHHTGVYVIHSAKADINTTIAPSGEYSRAAMDTLL